MNVADVQILLNCILAEGNPDSPALMVVDISTVQLAELLVLRLHWVCLVRFSHIPVSKVWVSFLFQYFIIIIITLNNTSSANTTTIIIKILRRLFGKDASIILLIIIKILHHFDKSCFNLFHILTLLVAYFESFFLGKCPLLHFPFNGISFWPDSFHRE
jgi:hypothetical protein